MSQLEAINLHSVCLIARCGPRWSCGLCVAGWRWHEVETSTCERDRCRRFWRRSTRRVVDGPWWRWSPCSHRWFTAPSQLYWELSCLPSLSLTSSSGGLQLLPGCWFTAKYWFTAKWPLFS